jgi:hypothetical protein
MPRLTAYSAALAVFVFSSSLLAVPLGTAFTYQGKIAQNGTDVSEICDFRFGVWDAQAGGAQVATAINALNVQVTEGTFTVELDYGAGIFDGDARWLEISVACPAGGGLTLLAPRQKLTPSPNAHFAAQAGAMEWTGLLNIPPDIADGDDVDDDDADPTNEIQDLSDVLAQGNDAGGTTITNLPAPVADSDASTKAYVDSQGSAQDLTDVLTQGNDAGGITITNLPAPVADSDASTKAYVDSQGGAQDLTDVLTQGNDAGGMTITNLPAPIADSDASTKAYVDSQGGAQDLTDVLTQGNDAGGITITNLPGPAAASDAATMAYVDAHEDDDADSTNELQDLSLGGNTLSLTDDATPVDLSGFLDNTDDQTLDLTADQLSIENGNSVNLSGYLDDTDDQNLADVLSQGNDAGGTTITNLPAPVAASDAATMAYVDAQTGSSQNLTQVLTEGNDAGGIAITNLPAPATGTDAATMAYVDAHEDDDSDSSNELQDLSLGGNTLSLTDDATPVDLAGYLDNTDDQTLDLTADQLSIENGNSVDLSGYLDDTDEQNLAEVLAQGNDAGGTTITNLPEPAAASDAATMAYVDAQAGGSQNLTEVLTEGNDAGGITITNLPAPVADSDASTKAYVDAQGGVQDLSDVLIQGNNASGITITNLPTPVAGTDAATRAFVDAHEDGDADSNNELQDLSLSSNTLSLSDDASPVDLSAYLDDTDDQTLAEVLSQGNDAGGTSISNLGMTTTNALTISALNCTTNANGGALTTNASGVVVCSDDEGGGGAGNTLDLAYDQGGPGAGRTITADAGPVTIQATGSQALNLITNFDPALVISPSSGTGEDTGLAIVGARNGSTTVDAAFVDLRDFDLDEGAGTLFTMARIGAGMQDAAGQTGFLRFYTNAGADLQERMRIDKLGNVSIGSDSGTERLKVAGDAVIGGGTGIGLHDGDSEYLRIRGRVDDWYLGVRDAPTGAEHDFFIGLSDIDFTRFNFDRNGNLGLGTEPEADLHLASTGSQQIWIQADTDNSGESDQPSFFLTQDGGLIFGAIGFFDSQNHLSIRTGDVGVGVTHLLLEPEGRVGVGTNLPQNKLDVQGPGTTAGGESGQVVARFRNTDASSNTGVSIDALADENSILYFANDGSPDWDWNVFTDPDTEDFRVLRARYHGGAGIKTVLRFVPDSAETGFGVGPGQDNNVRLGSSFLGAWESVRSYAFDNVSDARLKTAVQDLDYGIEAVMNLRPVRFRWLAHPESGDRIGVIAQEVAEVIPEIVNSDPEDPEQKLAVDYMELVPVLIRALQDQQQELESLRASVESLELSLEGFGELP